ncbi:MBG domain-containing protein, partial [Salinimicrobium marinum]|uniref:MBG domain-containing protein n=1 Tax=Salinimicrobium marinum TaxID=680283 RepID=UPI0027E55679
AAITVSADAKSKIYGEIDPVLTYQITSGTLVGNDDFTGSLTREVGEDVGTYAIQQGSLALSSNYDLTYNTADLTIKEAAITVTADAKSKVYGEADPALTYQITSGALVGNDDFTGSLSREAGEDVGTYEIQQGSLSLSSNYDLTYNTADLSIKEAAITVTADAKSKVYGEADPALTYQITSGALVGNDSFTGSLTREVGEDVGAYAIEQGSLALSSNYDLTYNTSDFTIKEAAITVSADSKSKVYGEADPALTYQITSGALVGNDSFTGSLTREVGEDVGAYAIEQG